MTQPASEPEISAPNRHGASGGPAKRGAAGVIVFVLVVVLLYAGSLSAYWFFYGSAVSSTAHRHRDQDRG